MKIFLRLYYWILFILSFVFELLSAAIWGIHLFIDFIDDKLLKHLINIGNKIDD